MSGTPQTDIRVWCTADGHLVVDAEHASQLERELTASAAQVAKLQEQIDLQVPKQALQELAAQVERLQAWKEGQLAVEASWDEQAVGKALGLPLGTPIRQNILPAVERMRRALDGVLPFCGPGKTYTTEEWEVASANARDALEGLKP